MITTPIIKRGEIWLIDFEPARGSEIQKERPAIVISSDNIGKLPMKVVVPLTEWKDYFVQNNWMTKILQTKTNNLDKDSAADAYQIRAVDIQRFKNKIGKVTADELEEIAINIGAVVEYI